MAENLNISREPIIIGLLLTVCIQLNVHAWMSCPTSCNCTYPVWYHKEAECRFGDTTVSIVFDWASLKLICRGTNYSCADMPQIPSILGDERDWSVKVTSCDWKVLRCVSHITQRNIVGLELTDMTDADKEIPNGIFHHMTDPKKLLGRNLQLFPNMFYGSEIEEVELVNNNISIVPDHTFNDSSIVNLRLLDININNISIDTFGDQKRLEYLTITSNGQLKFIAPDAFSGTPKLKELVITYASLVLLPTGLIFGLNNIKEITIQNNAVQMSLEPHVFEQRFSEKEKTFSYGNVSNSGYKFNNTIYEIHLSNNSIEVLPQEIFLETIYVTDINLSKNKIKTIPEGIFSNLKHLIYVDLRKNNIIELPGNLFTSCPELENVNLANNNIEVLPHKIFSETISVIYIYLNRNKIKTIPEGIFSNLEYVDLSENNIIELPGNLFTSCPKLKRVFLDSNNIEVLPHKIFSESVTNIHLNRNKIKTIPEGIFSNLEYVDLSENNIIELPENLFTSCPKLETVLLDSNNITTLDLDIFNNTNLFQLSIASNKLRQLDSSTSLRFSVLHLDLSHNDISEIQEWLVDSTKLVPKITTERWRPKIYLSHNNISDIILKEQRQYQHLFHIKLPIKLSHNPITCSCHVSMILNEWHKDRKLLDFEDIICSDGEHLSTINPYEVCNRTHALVGLIGSSCMASFILFLCLIKIFASRYKIKTYITNTFKSSRDSLTIQQTHYDDAKTYDLFVSFAHQDREFVMDTLLPKLENDYNQKVCVHYRDWIVGELIPDLIIQSVDNARMTLILLTEHFLASEWSYLEFRAAHTLGMQEGRSKLIIILFDEAIINDERLFAEVKSHLVVNNYLLWGDSQFWEKLQKMLPRKGKKLKSRNRV